MQSANANIVDFDPCLSRFLCYVLSTGHQTINFLMLIGYHIQAFDGGRAGFKMSRIFVMCFSSKCYHFIHL